MTTTELLIVTGPSYEDAQEQIQSIPDNFDGIEIRLDLFNTIDLPSIAMLIEINRKKTMLTLRSRQDGGGFCGSQTKQITLIKSLLKLKIDVMDIEHKLENLIQSKKSLTSFHSFNHGIENLDKLYQTLKRGHDKSIKLCLKAESKNQAKRYLNFLEQKKKQNETLTVLSPNKAGLITRRFGPRLGNEFNYTACPSKNKSALFAIFT